MKPDWDAMPTWPLHVGLYILAGSVVTQSIRIEDRAACDAGSSITVRQQLVLGAIWPVTAGRMMLFHQNPMASIFGPSRPPARQAG